MTVEVSDDLRMEHMDFHTKRRQRWNDEGEGLKFLTFHRRFVSKVRREFLSNGDPDPARNWPRWYSIPPELQVSQLPPMPSWWFENDDCEEDDWKAEGLPPDTKFRAADGWNGQSAVWENLLNRGDLFSSDDDWGRTFEQGLHGYLHSTGSWVYRDRNLRSMSCAPKSECFYAIHGMITYLWNRFRQRKYPPPPPDPCQAWLDRIDNLKLDIENLGEEMREATPQRKGQIKKEIDQVQSDVAAAQESLERCRKSVVINPVINDVTTLSRVAALCEHLATHSNSGELSRAFAESNAPAIETLCKKAGLHGVAVYPPITGTETLLPLHHMGIVINGWALTVPFSSSAAMDYGHPFAGIVAGV